MVTLAIAITCLKFVSLARLHAFLESRALVFKFFHGLLLLLKGLVEFANELFLHRVKLIQLGFVH